MFKISLVLHLPRVTRYNIFLVILVFRLVGETICKAFHSFKLQFDVFDILAFF